MFQLQLVFFCRFSANSNKNPKFYKNSFVFHKKLLEKDNNIVLYYKTVAGQLSRQSKGLKIPVSPVRFWVQPPFFVYTPVNLTGFLFSPPQITLKKCLAACPESYQPRLIWVKLLCCSDFLESRCACIAVALCEGVSTLILDTVRNLLQINACLLQYFLYFVPSRNPYQARCEPPSFVK